MISMDNDPRDEQESYAPVDSAGCEWGEISRPARFVESQDDVLLMDPSENDTYLVSTNTVELEEYR